MPWQETIARIRELTGDAPALVDATGVGDPVLEALQRGGMGNFEGFKFSAISKQQLMEGLAVAIQRREVRFPDGALRVELEQFEFEYSRTGVRYAAPEGSHDDCVCALALAWRKGSVPQPGGCSGGCWNRSAPIAQRRSLIRCPGAGGTIRCRMVRRSISTRRPGSSSGWNRGTFARRAAVGSGQAGSRMAS